MFILCELRLSELAASVYKTMKLLIPDNDVIQDVHPDHFSGFNEFVCKGLIFRTGRRVSSGMVMRADDRHREVLEGALEDFADDRRGVVDGALFHILDRDDAVLGIEEDDLEDFFFKVPHPRHQDIDDVLGGFDPRAIFFNLVLPETPADFQRGLNLGDLGGPETFEFHPVPRVGVAHVPEGLEFVDDFSGEVQRALAFGAGAQQDGKQLGIA